MNRRRTEILDVGESTLDVGETTCRRNDPKAKRPVTGYHQYLFYGHIRVVCRDVQNCKFSARLIKKYRNRMNKPTPPPPQKKKKIFNDITHSACQIAFTCNKYLQVSERRRNEGSGKVS